MEQLSIRLKIGNREYPMTIKKEEEELIRKVGKEINEQINSYKTKMNIDDLPIFSIKVIYGLR